MHKLLVFLFALGSIHTLAQRAHLELLPVTGPVSSYEIYVQSTDTSKHADYLIEVNTFDKNGRLLEIKKGNGYSNRFNRFEKHIYSKNTETIYSCECSDIETFIKDFSIKKKEDVKERGYASDNPIQQQVIKRERDKKGNIISETYYAKNGVRQHLEIRKYDKKNQVVLIRRFNADSILVWEEKKEYDTRGNVIKHVVNDPMMDNKFTTTKVYDTSKRLISSVFQSNDDWRRDDFHFEKSGDQWIETLTWIFPDDTIKKSQTTYDSKNRIIEVIHFKEDGGVNLKTTYTYDSHDNLVIEERYNKDNKLSKKFEYTYDDRHNWVKVVHTYLVNLQTGNKVVEQYDTETFIQRIVYSN